jgi:hypothetical protein
VFRSVAVRSDGAACPQAFVTVADTDTVSAHCYSPDVYLSTGAPWHADSPLSPTSTDGAEDTPELPNLDLEPLPNYAPLISPTAARSIISPFAPSVYGAYPGAFPADHVDPMFEL